jgi:protein-L-isoaspartate(D-aspartate) O-methyltransferase
MSDLSSTRRAYAEQIAASANLQTPALIDALAAVPRERFLRPGPWLTIGTQDARQPPAWTPDDNPVHVYQDASVAIDAERQLFNGAPSFLCGLIDRLGLRPGGRVVHIGAGLGYYSALMAHVVGPSGRVVAVEVDPGLAEEARTNLAAMPWADVRQDDGAHIDGPVDAMLVNAGVTHPRPSWLDALAPGGRLLVPLTVSMPAMGASLGKGVMLTIVRRPDDVLFPEVTSFVAIYNAAALRDAAVEAALGQAMRRTSFPNLTRVRRDDHSPGEGCWLHTGELCLSMD